MLFSAVGKNGKTNDGTLPISGYDFARDIPIVVNTPEDTFLFFFASKQDISTAAPVAQHTLEGWVWKQMDCISRKIRRRALFFDVLNGIVLDGTGNTIADINKVKDKLPAGGNAINVECLRDGDLTNGMVAYAAPYEKQRPPLPYDSLYRYAIRDGDQDAEAWKLGPMKDGPAFDPDTPTLAGKAVPSPDDIVTYGKPVSDGQRVFYWYCIHPKDSPTYRVYILACNDGIQTVAIDGYIVNPPNVRYWKDNAWVKEERQLEWDYQQQLDLPVQPIVGKDANGKILSYRPPELWQLDLITDNAGEVHLKEIPTGGFPAK